ncbi:MULTISPECIES: hypothetical protein [Kamptonema]|uniref:hypothetical protein n=1 Tax=Kamptonema TaxID=1501433 RepID=UPI0001DAC385|nr:MULTISPECIES: hypothetical protein [Kamptonema]CBN54261.1 conserved membrane hypothetical protein [Kamptonema sp. PCC 6506]
MNLSPSQPAVLWRQVGGLAAVQAAITLTWMIYRIYVPQLLAGFGFPGLEQPISMIEDALAVALEPIMGGISDKQRQWMGSRFPLISLGIILSSALFIAIPAVFIFGKPYQVFRWVLPVLLVAWALAMAVFRAPAVSLIGQYAVNTQLPQAMSVLILIGGLAGAARPIAGDFILSLGPGITFTIGSLVLLGAVAVLRSQKPDMSVAQTPINHTTNQPLSIPALGLIAVTGMSIACGTRLMLGEILPKVLETQIGGTDVKLLLVGIAIALAFASLPAGILATRLGNQRVTIAGLVIAAMLLLALVFAQGTGAIWILIIALIASYSLVANGAIPFVFSLIPPHRGGLGVGIYFGGFSLAMSLYGVILGPLLRISLLNAAIVGAIAFLLAGACLEYSLLQLKSHPF